MRVAVVGKAGNWNEPGLTEARALLAGAEEARCDAVATASDGVSHGYKTNGSGYADIYLDAGRGDTIKVTVGPASCSTKGN